MPLGPVEMLVVKFPGNQFSGEIVPALAELVELGMIHVVDLLFVIKDEGGAVTVLEFTDLTTETFGQFAPIVSDITPMLTDDDALKMAESLENNSSAGLMLFENRWAKRFADAVVAANGEVMLNERIPRVVIEELEAASA